jgi:hypothetical protein
MGATLNNGFPYPEDTDPIAQGAQSIKGLANALDVKLGKDTGWLAIVGVTGWTVTGGIPWQARQIGNVVWFRGGMNHGTFTSTPAYTQVGTLPAGITLPPGTNVFTALNSSAAITTWLVNTAGGLQVYRSAATSVGLYLSGASYFTS